MDSKQQYRDFLDIKSIMYWKSASIILSYSATEIWIDVKDRFSRAMDLEYFKYPMNWLTSSKIKTLLVFIWRNGKRVGRIKQI